MSKQTIKKSSQPLESFIPFEDFDYGFSPSSYFSMEDSPLQYLLSKVTGTERRRVIQDAFQKGEAIPESALAGSLSTELRDWVSSIHPSFMGGEYLPEIGDAEVELCRVELKSTTRDVISIRARWKNSCYRYAVLDEYETEFILPVKQSVKPMNFGKFLTFLNRVNRADDSSVAGIVTLYAEASIRCGSSYSQMVGFQTARSEVYPELKRYYSSYIPTYLKLLTTNN